LLKGTWGPNQTAQATVRSVKPNQDGNVWEEVELRLRSSISPHNCTGYEIMFRCSKIPKAYCNIARWEGPLGKFTMLKQTEGPEITRHKSPTVYPSTFQLLQAGRAGGVGFCQQS